MRAYTTIQLPSAVTIPAENSVIVWKTLSHDDTIESRRGDSTIPQLESVLCAAAVDVVNRKKRRFIFAATRTLISVMSKHLITYCTIALSCLSSDFLSHSDTVCVSHLLRTLNALRQTMRITPLAAVFAFLAEGFSRSCYVTTVYTATYSATFTVEFFGGFKSHRVLRSA